MHGLQRLIILPLLLAACGDVPICAVPCENDRQCQAEQAGSVCAPINDGPAVCHLPGTVPEACTEPDAPTTASNGDCSPPCASSAECEAGEVCGPVDPGGVDVCFVPCNFTDAAPWCPGSGACNPVPGAGVGGIGSGFCAPTCRGG